jgi:hypothetical protein
MIKSVALMVGLILAWLGGRAIARHYDGKDKNEDEDEEARARDAAFNQFDRYDDFP